MEIQPIVIGTAGHIDHGKSTLVRALTGVDPDRLKEEQERGLTIDLGFAPLELPDGRLVGIIDVPGHERFIKNMVAGASGIDLVVLVVAADDGVMPQTREHLAIMRLLGVKRGVIALTKIDMVEEELRELALLDVREAVEGTFLEDAPLLCVSAVSGEGLDEFRATLFELAARSEPRSAGGVFRMPVQRVFSARGFGTILTGIPIAGEVRPGDVLEVLPGGHKGRVRGIQAYKQSAESGRAGHSTAINISDVPHAEVQRGCVLAAPGYFRAVRMVGARLFLLEELERPLADRTAIRLHIGTAEVVGEVVLLDAAELRPGTSGLVQLRLTEPVVCAPGDRFIIRLASPLMTLGGGVILEESRYRLKRFKGFVLDELSRQEGSLGSNLEQLETGLLRAGEQALSVEELSVLVKCSRESVRELLAELAGRGAVVQVGKDQRWMHADGLEAALEGLRTAIGAWFTENPLRSVMDLRDLRQRVRHEGRFLDALLEEECVRGGLQVESGGKLRLAGRDVELDPETERLRQEVLEHYDTAGFQPPTREELSGRLGLAEARSQALYEALVDRGELEHVGKGLYISGPHLERARAAVVGNCERNGSLAIPELRDELGTTRKFLIPLLEYFDAQGVTLRQAGHRVLRRR